MFADVGATARVVAAAFFQSLDMNHPPAGCRPRSTATTLVCKTITITTMWAACTWASTRRPETNYMNYAISGTVLALLM
jgi:hypothetical protein